MKKLLAVVLALALVLTLAAPLMAQADGLEEITILYPGEETDAFVGNIALEAPGTDVVHIQFRNVAVFPFQKIKRIGIAFVQDVVHVQADPKTIFSHGIPAFKTMDLYWIITSLYHIVAPVGNPNEQRIELRNCRMKGCQKQGRML